MLRDCQPLTVEVLAHHLYLAWTEGWNDAVDDGATTVRYVSDSEPDA